MAKNTAKSSLDMFSSMKKIKPTIPTVIPEDKNPPKLETIASPEESTQDIVVPSEKKTSPSGEKTVNLDIPAEVKGRIQKSIYISAEIDRKLCAIAREKGVSYSSLVEYILGQVV